MCEKIDPDDITFVAAAICFRVRLWTGDIKLIVGLERLDFKRIITIEGLYLEFPGKDKRKWNFQPPGCLLNEAGQ